MLAGLAGAMLLAAGPAAQSEPAPGAKTVSGVTVTAPEKPNPLVDKTTQFVHSDVPEDRAGQLSRFRDEICVKVIGLPPAYAAFIAKRVKAVANSVHAPVDRAATWPPNVSVIFSPDRQAQLNDIAKPKDIRLGFYWNKRDLKQLATFKRPIGAWHVTRMRGQFGESRLEINDPTDCQNPRLGWADSRLSNGMITEVVHSLILADANKVAGEKIDAIADYIAVLSLAKWRGLGRCNATPTILNQMADGCDKDTAHEAATPQDLALLTGLYSIDPRELGPQQRATIASAVCKASSPEPTTPQP